MIDRGTLTALGAASLLLVASAPLAPPHATAETLLETEHTVLDQSFSYPEGEAKITAAIVTVPRGADVPEHLHPVPLFAYILQGELIVDYGEKGERTYRKGDSFVEAIDWPHRGRNGGRRTVKILAVYAGAEGAANSRPVDEPHISPRR